MYAKAKVAEVPADAGKCRCDEPAMACWRIELDWFGLVWAGLVWAVMRCTELCWVRLVETKRDLARLPARLTDCLAVCLTAQS